MDTILTMAIKDENRTSIQVSKKLVAAIKKDGVMGMSYEDVIWMWQGKHLENKRKKDTKKDKDIGDKLG